MSARVTIQFRVTEKKKRRIQREAKRWKHSMSAFILKAVDVRIETLSRWAIEQKVER